MVGVPVFDIPVLGYPASFLGTAQGKLVFIVLLIIFTADLMQLDECQRLSDYLEEKDIEDVYKRQAQSRALHIQLMLLQMQFLRFLHRDQH